MLSKFMPSTVPRVNYLQEFSLELSNIDKLEQTPSLIREIAIQALDAAINRGETPTTVRALLQNNKTSLENIDNSSIQENFKIIYSQMCILAVSCLEATLKKYFENALNGFNGINLENDELKKTSITLAELAKNGLSYRSEFGSLVLDKVKLNFQDLQAIKRNFEKYLSKNVTLNLETQKKICFYLELRHVLVHKGGFIDKKFVDATNVFDANFKGYQERDRVEIVSADWCEIKNCFTQLIEDITRYIPQSNE